VRIAWIAALAAALVFAGQASASIMPPPGPLPLHPLRLGRAHARVALRTCMAQQARLKVARWLAPVACEQPPRSELLLVAPLFGGA
jgi:hypothetical protein